MQVKIKVRRRPARGKDPYWQKFEREAEARARVLDLLLEIRRAREPRLAFRASCKSGQCGACAIEINGEPRLACRTLLADLDRPRHLVLRPLAGRPVKKDLVVELEDLENHAGPGSGEPATEPAGNEAQQINERMREAAVCNRCGACVSACPISWSRPQFEGPAGLVKLYRELQTAAGEEASRLLGAIDRPEGAWGCETDYNCLEVCPRGINVTALISKLKREILEK